MTRTWWDAEALVELVLGTEAAPAEYEDATLLAALTSVAVDEQLTEPARSLVVELRPPARHAWELAGALQVQTQRVVSGMDGLLTVARMLGLRVAHLR
ncbi:MAG: hypothetical protein R2755_12155 [Acidimicrobiales bacterium]